MSRTFIYIILIVIVASVFAETSITSAIDNNEITIGDRIHYKIEIYYPKESSLNTPSIGNNLGMFEIQDFQVLDPVETEDGNLYQEIEYTISTFTTGEYIIPPIGILITDKSGARDTLITQPIAINVKSLLDGKSPDELDIRGIKAPLKYPRDYTWVWYLVGFVLLALAIVFVILYYLKKKSQGLGLFDFISPPKPAYSIALERLEQIRDMRYLVFNEANLYFIELSEILREYVENQLHVPSLEMTSVETIDGLRKNGVISTKLIADVQTVLTESDMVKFAHLMPENQRGQILWQLANNL